MTKARRSPLPPQPTEPDERDAASIITRTALGVVPLIGGPAAELFNFVVVPSLERRKAEWLNDLAERVRELQAEERLTFEDLKSDAVVDAMLHASQAAMRTSSEEKRAAMRNAVLNTALPGAPGAMDRYVFLRFVDEFSEWHLRVLKLFQSPSQWEKANGTKFTSNYSGALADILNAAFPELAARRPFCDLVWSDLERAGFVNGSLHTMMTGHGLLQPRTTEEGNRFLAFIEEPQESPRAGL